MRSRLSLLVDYCVETDRRVHRAFRRGWERRQAARENLQILLRIATRLARRLRRRLSFRWIRPLDLREAAGLTTRPEAGEDPLVVRSLAVSEARILGPLRVTLIGIDMLATSCAIRFSVELDSQPEIAFPKFSDIRLDDRVHTRYILVGGSVSSVGNRMFECEFTFQPGLLRRGSWIAFEAAVGIEKGLDRDVSSGPTGERLRFVVHL